VWGVFPRDARDETEGLWGRVALGICLRTSSQKSEPELIYQTPSLEREGYRICTRSCDVGGFVVA
jgi:hypothetical protein